MFRCTISVPKEYDRGVKSGRLYFCDKTATRHDKAFRASRVGSKAASRSDKNDDTVVGRVRTSKEKLEGGIYDELR